MDYAVFSSNGGVLVSAMIVYSDSSGNSWSGGSQIYDPVNPTIFNISGGVLSVDVLC